MRPTVSTACPGCGYRLDRNPDTFQWSHAGLHPADCVIKQNHEPVSNEMMSKFKTGHLRVNPNVEGGIEAVTPSKSEPEPKPEPPLAEVLSFVQYKKNRKIT